MREKVRRILKARPAIAAALKGARREDEQGVSFEPNLDKVRNVVLKCARGHAAFELNEPQWRDPSHVSIQTSYDDDRRRTREIRIAYAAYGMA